MRESIDLNADLGEGFGVWRLGDDDALLDVVTSASIACGFHAGDPTIMLTSCRRAAERDVAIGAHVSYRDLAGFGRRELPVSADELYADVVHQLGALQAAARAAATAVRYVKPHGALYNRIVHDEVQAEAVARAVSDVAPGLPLLGLAASAIERAAAAAGLPFVREAFIDRGYRADGTLVPRGEPGAVLADPRHVAERAVQVALTGRVEAVSGESIRVDVDSLCVHGDTPGAVEMAEAVRASLLAAGLLLAPAAP
ncbi:MULTISPECIES: LamB/YcsF family protein [unclassified Rathayibacter]|uniref:LamB/YcsF family protein n=1 Tax=unclassified Rathayibacter TaxID=2609250 RepID=UPI00188A610C|nr:MULTISPECIES: 5-oxoprolinase subunit PxpA [unclassified Rathayibacter]MBF4461686.1 LamB/YcsF family protein [Rathayibacter sp. VKM Ac-2879]MBF4503097.1 LamB/YcsF family protein [Rathayibacter sp. VKM Ac-2878]